MHRDDRSLGCLATWTDLDPGADVTVPEIPVVGFGNKTLHDGGLDLAPDEARRANRRSWSDACSVDDGSWADVTGAIESAEGAHLGATIDHDRASGGIGDDHRLDSGRRVDTQTTCGTDERDVDGTLARLVSPTPEVPIDLAAILRE
jgi:hypothetical protein